MPSRRISRRREGSYWHAIAHRVEPDAWNSGYWFRRVGNHAVFPLLHQAADRVLKSAGVTDWRLPSAWDPLRFIEWCTEARRTPGSKKENAALAIQRAEWDLLFGWCAGSPFP